MRNLIILLTVAVLTACNQTQKEGPESSKIDRINDTPSSLVVTKAKTIGNLGDLYIEEIKVTELQTGNTAEGISFRKLGKIEYGHIDQSEISAFKSALTYLKNDILKAAPLTGNTAIFTSKSGFTVGSIPGLFNWKTFIRPAPGQELKLITETEIDSLIKIITPVWDKTP